MLKASLFGQFDLCLDGQPVNVPSRPAQALLAFLLLNRETTHRRERLAGLLWPDHLESSARHSLRNALWHLRRAIGDLYVLADRTSLAFNTDAPYNLDVETLESELAAQNLDTLISAVSVYAGELLPGFYEDWVSLERERLRALFERRVGWLLDGLAAAGRWADVQTWAERWIALAPVPEPAFRALMKAHAARGDLAGMANSYRRCLQALADELDIPPSRETRQLYVGLSSGDISLVAPRGSPPSPAAQPTSGERRPNSEPEDHLPALYTPFFGREEELGEIGRLLKEEADCRLLTLVGPGGIGKTRLALESARGTSFPHGAWFVPLAALGSKASLLSAVAGALRLQLHGGTDARAQLFAHLRDRELLLVLDSIEPLLSPASHDQDVGRHDGLALLTQLLERAPGIKILVTSRERLRLSAEWVFNVAGLRCPERPEDIEAIEDTVASGASFSAIQLFLQRARQVKRTFGQEADELACVARICQLVGGMPLAIELAAAWTNVLACRDILQEIERNLDFLRTSMRDYPERHRDIQAVFDSSWQLLAESERRLFRRLSVFRGGCTRAAAEALGSATAWTEEDLVLAEDGTLQLTQRQPQVLTALGRLVDQSFVRHTPSGRYEIHELMRQYGAAKLLQRPGEEREARDNHARYYIALLVGYEAPLRGAEQSRVVKQLVPELENIKAAWNWAVARRRLDWLDCMLPGWLWLFEVRNDYEQAAAAALHAVETFRRRGAPAALNHVDERAHFAFLLSQAAWFAFLSGRTARGRALSDEALSLAGPGSTPEHGWYMHSQRGYMALATGNHIEARRFSQRGLGYARRLANPWHLGFPLAQLGMIALEEGDPQDAYDRLQESMALWRQVGNPRGLIFAYTNLGTAALALGKTEEALAYAEKSLALSVDVNDRWSEANALKLIGQAQTARSDYQAAHHSFHQSITLYHQVDDRRGAAQALVDLGHIAADAGQVDQAKAAFLEALPAAQQAQAVATGLSALAGLAKLETAGARPDWAYALASYVATHPQANEYAREAAGQVIEEIEGRVSAQKRDAVTSRYQGSPFEKVVGGILAEDR